MSQVYLSQYSKRAALADLATNATNATSASYAATASYVNPLKLDPIQDPNPTGLLYTSSTYFFQSSSNTALGYDLYFRQNGNLTKWKWIEGMMNTGLLYGGVLSYSASSFLITPGAGLIVNHNAVTGSEISPMMEYVTWGPITQSIENIATYQNTFVYIDSNGSASQQNVFFTPEQYQIYIPIGRVSHYNNVVANNAYENVQTSYDIDGQQNIFVRAFGPLKLKGIATSGQTGTLRLNIGSGTAFNLGAYYPYDSEIPSTYNMSTYDTASIIRIYRSGSGYRFDDNGGSYYTTINPVDYDDGTGILAAVGNNNWSIQRVMVNPVTGRAHVYYGQNVYGSYDDAVGSIFSDGFIESDATANSYPFSAYLIVRGNTADLTDTVNNKIVQAGLFRSVAGGGATGGGGIPGGQNTQIQFNNAGVFDGEPEFTFDYLTNTLTLTGSMLVDGAISASFGANTIGFFGTASWAVSASQALTSSRAFSSSYALSASQATTASYALTSSFSVSASYASSSHNFANTDLVFTGDRKHDTNKHSFFLYSDLIGGNETDPFDGFGVSGSFYYFNSSSNTLGTAAGSTNTYTYIQITSQSIDLSFNANPIITKAYRFTATSASFSGSLVVSESLYLPGLTTTPQSNVVVIDTTTGQLYYTASSAFGGGGSSGDFVPSAWTGSSTSQFAGTASYVSGSVFNSTNPALSASYASGSTSASYALSASFALASNPAPSDTYVQYNNNGAFGASSNFIFDYNNNLVQIKGRLEQAGGSATSTGAHAEGNKTTAKGAYSHAEGDTTTAEGEASHAAGFGSYALGKYQSVIGQWNVANTSQSAFIIGDGADGSNRHNLLFASQSWFEVSASNVFLKGLTNTAKTNVITIDTTTGQLFYTASSAIGGGSGTPTPPATPLNSIQFNSASTFGGSNNFTFISSSSEVYLTGSMIVSGAISASYGPNTIGFYGTASWAQSASQAISASYAGSASVLLNPYPINVTGSTLYSVSPGSFIVGNPGNPNNTANSIFLGSTAGGGAGFGGGLAQGVIAIGPGAGNGVCCGDISYSNFIGNSAGYSSFHASQSNFIGASAGYFSYGAHNSNFIGNQAGAFLSTLDSSYSSGSYSNFIGHQAGLGHGDGFGNFSSVGHNNTIIGTNISLPDNTSNYVNLGGAFFISGTYFNNSLVFPDPYNSAILTSSINTAKVGINLWNPSYSLHVSGTVGFPNLTDSNTAAKVVLLDNNGQLFTTASNAIGGGGSSTPAFPFNGNAIITGSLLVSGSSGGFSGITGSLFGTASWATNALTASFSPNFGNTNLTLTNNRTHTGGGFRYRFFNSGSALDYTGGNQFIESDNHTIGIRSLKGGGNYDATSIQMTTSSLTIRVGDENNALSGLRQLTVTTSSIILTGSLNVTGQSFSGSIANFSSDIVVATRSAAPGVDIGVEGQIVPVNNAGTYLLYVYIGGRWRSSSLF